jgi:hypothetical protein
LNCNASEHSDIIRLLFSQCCLVVSFLAFLFAITVAASIMNSTRHASGRKPINTKNPKPERASQQKAHRPVFQSTIRHKNEGLGAPKSQTPSQRDAEDNPLGIFGRLPYELRLNIWFLVAASATQDPFANLNRFKWPEK